MIDASGDDRYAEAAVAMSVGAPERDWLVDDRFSAADAMSDLPGLVVAVVSSAGHAGFLFSAT
jgi:hypothetical protein